MLIVKVAQGKTAKLRRSMASSMPKRLIDPAAPPSATAR